MSKIKMFDIIKVKIQDIIKSDFKLHIKKEDQNKYIIQQQDTPLFRQLSLIRGCESKLIYELIFVEAKHNKKRTDQLTKLINDGFRYNNKRYVRFGKSSSQAKDGITVFIDAEIHSEMLERSQLGLKIDKCVVSKYESYRNLILSSCQMVNDKLPYIIIVDEFEKFIPNQYVRFATKKDVEIIDKGTWKKKKIKNRVIEENYADIKISPFDGFGLHTKEVSKLFNEHISNKHDSILFQIRLPFMKGVSVEFSFRKYLKEVLETDEIVDVFGHSHKVDDIDCIWNTSMWKGYSIFKNAFGNEGWNEYIKRVNKYGYKLGVSKFSHHTDDINVYSRLNFQYLQCLDLLNPKYLQQFKDKNIKYDILNKNNAGKIINIAKYSTDLIEKIVKGDKLYTLKFLGINDTAEQSLNSKYIEAILTNDSMLKDPTIKKMLKRKLDKTITQMKYGKIYASGFYHTVIGDVIGYLEHCAGKDVIGCLNAGEFYVNTLPLGECLSFRSPLVDPSEVNKVILVTNEITNKYFQHFKDQDVCMINMYDLTMQQQGGMDTDGDSVFLCNEKILLESKIDKPIVVDMEDKMSCDPVEYNKENITKYELNSRDNRIGEITNIATSILNQYTENEKWKKINDDNISLLRLYQGKEIDFVKTGFRWIISKNLRKYLKRLPYFLLYNYPKKLNVYNKLREINKNNNAEDKVEYNAYRSPSAMNELCDYICQWEKQSIDWDRSLINNGHLMIDKELDLSDKNIMKNIKRVLDQFTLELRNSLDEEEDKISQIADDYKIKLNEIIVDQELLANYCIKTAYRSLGTDKVLCWMLFGDVMLKNLKVNSDERKELEIAQTDRDDVEGKEFLGKYYKLVKKI